MQIESKIGGNELFLFYFFFFRNKNIWRLFRVERKTHEISYVTPGRNVTQKLAIFQLTLCG